MPWLRFTRAFDWRPPGTRVVVAYPEGHVGLVTTACATAVLAAGAAERSKKPAGAKEGEADAGRR